MSGIPFTNNLDEQAARMPKVKEKIPGGFRTPGVRDTLLHKRGANIFFTLTFYGDSFQPRIA